MNLKTWKRRFLPVWRERLEELARPSTPWDELRLDLAELTAPR